MLIELLLNAVGIGAVQIHFIHRDDDANNVVCSRPADD
jgi:hypothetical protein